MYSWAVGATSLSPDSRSHLGLKKIPVYHRGADKQAPRAPEVAAPRPQLRLPGITLATQALAARGDSLEHLRARVAVLLSRSTCPPSLPTVVGVAGEQDDLKRRMNEYMLHEEYHESIRGEDGEDLIKAQGSPPQTNMYSYYYSGPATDLADTASLPRSPRGNPWPTFSTPPWDGPTWRPDLPKTTRT